MPVIQNLLAFAMRRFDALFAADMGDCLLIETQDLVRRIFWNVLIVVVK
jgi:hypothetical protein